MNILFIGPYRQSDEYAKFAIDYIKALVMTENDIAIAPIYMANNINKDITDELKKLENKNLPKYDVIIQNVLPIFFEKQEGYNIGICCTETKSLNNSLYIDKMNLMDELWVCSESEKETLIKSGVKCKINIVPIPLDIEELEKNKNNNLLNIPQIKEKFVFYIIGDYIERKDIKSTVIAFNREFSNNKKVVLIIKTGINNVSNEQGIPYIQNDIIELKKKMRLYNTINSYTNEIIVGNNLNISELISLHKSCNCLIISSKAESYSREALQAIFLNNNVICNNGIHFFSKIKNKCHEVESHEVPCLINDTPHPLMYTGWETWNEIDILKLQEQMRNIYENKKTNSEEDNTQWIIDNFSYKNISQKMKEILCQL